MLKFDGDLYVLVPLDVLYFLVVSSVVRFLLYQVLQYSDFAEGSLGCYDMILQNLVPFCSCEHLLWHLQVETRRFIFDNRRLAR